MSDPDVCPACHEGRYDRESGVVTLPNECCAAHFYGRGSWAYGQWVGHAKADETLHGVPALQTPEERIAKLETEVARLSHDVRTLAGTVGELTEALLEREDSR